MHLFLYIPFQLMSGLLQISQPKNFQSFYPVVIITTISPVSKIEKCPKILIEHLKKF